MDVLHITQTKNIPNIIKNGILRSKPLLSQYDRLMKEDYEDGYDEDKGLIFGIPENIDRRDKYIKDFCYWKTWGEPRNLFLHNSSYNQYSKYEEMGTKTFSHIKITPIDFSVLLVEIPFMWTYDHYIHGQSTWMGVLWDDMDVRYEHENKPLVLINYDIKPKNIKKVIATGESVLKRNNKIDIRLSI